MGKKELQKAGKRPERLRRALSGVREGLRQVRHEARHAGSRGRYIKAFAFFIFAFLTFLSLLLYERTPTGFVTLQDLSPDADWQAIPKSQWVGWEPIGAYSDREYKNYIGKDPVSGKYYLVYMGDDMNLSYIIDKNPQGTALQLFRGIFALTSYRGEDYYFRLNKEGLSLALDGEEQLPWIGGGVTRTLESEEIGRENVTLGYRFRRNSDSVLIRVTYTIKGKTLISHISSDSPKVSAIIMGQTGGEGQAESVTAEMPYTERVERGILKGELFYTIYNDFELSRATNLQYGIPGKVADTTSNLNIFINYKKNSAGQRKPLSEKLYFTLSPELLDIYPRIPNNRSQYRDYLSGKVILDFWSSNYSYNNYFLYSQKLWNYGLTDLHVIIDGWGKGPWPHFIPPGRGEQAFVDMVRNHNSLGYNVSVYTIWQDIYKGSPYYGDEYCMHYANGTVMKGWCNGEECTCPMKYERRLEVAKTQEPEMHTYGLMGEFSDAIATGLPDGYVDMTAGTQVDAEYRKAIPYMKELADYIRQTQTGPLSSEGFNPMFWVGIIDTFEASNRCCTNNQVDPVIVDYDLAQIHPLVTPYGGYYRRFFDADNNVRYKGITDSGIDKYMATHLAFGHLGYIDSTSPWLHNISDRTVVRIYYMWKQLQEQFATSEATSISYLSGGAWKSLSDAMRDGYDFTRSQVRITYGSGLTVYINRHPSNNLIATYEGNQYTIPPSGWLAYSSTLFEFSGLQEGTRIDIAETASYTFVDTRNRAREVVLHDNSMYTAKTLGANGLVDADLQFYLKGGKTAFLADGPYILRRSSEACDWQCSSWDDCSDGWKNRSCICPCGQCFGTAPDTEACVAPVMTGLAYSAPRTNQATITWQTDRAADTVIRFGTVSGIYSGQTENLTMATMHTAHVSLAPNTTYYMIAESGNDEGVARSSEFVIRTQARQVRLPSGITAQVAGSADLDRIYTGSQEVVLYGQGAPIARLTHDFASPLDLSGMTYRMNSTSLSVTGLDMQKELLIRASVGSRICLKDSEGHLAPGLACDSADETLLTCPGANGRYYCNLEGSLYAVAGLQHSSVSKYACPETYECTAWSECVHGQMTRQCSCPCMTCTGDSNVIASCISPPEISGIRHSFISASKALVTWQTDVPSRSSVSLGQSMDNYSGQFHNDTMGLSHSVLITAEPGTEYHYRVISTNELNDSRQSVDMTLFMPERRIAVPDHVNVSVNGSSDMDGLYQGTSTVVLSMDGARILEFSHDFRQSLNLSNLSLTYGDLTVISGLGVQKKAYVRNRTGEGKVCVADYAGANATSPGCDLAGETLISCPGTAGNYSCELTSEGYAIAGLSHCALEEVSCTWQCSDWDDCKSGERSRVCKCPCGTNCTGDSATEQQCESAKTKRRSSGGGGGIVSQPAQNATSEPVQEPVKPTQEKKETPAEQRVQEIVQTMEPPQGTEELPIQETPIPVEPVTVLDQLKKHDKGILILTILAIIGNVLVWAWFEKARRISPRQ